MAAAVSPLELSALLKAEEAAPAANGVQRALRLKRGMAQN